MDFLSAFDDMEEAPQEEFVVEDEGNQAGIEDAFQMGNLDTDLRAGGQGFGFAQVKTGIKNKLKNY